MFHTKARLALEGLVLLAFCSLPPSLALVALVGTRITLCFILTSFFVKPEWKLSHLFPSRSMQFPDIAALWTSLLCVMDVVEMQSWRCGYGGRRSMKHLYFLCFQSAATLHSKPSRLLLFCHHTTCMLSGCLRLFHQFNSLFREGRIFHRIFHILLPSSSPLPPSPSL